MTNERTQPMLKDESGVTILEGLLIAAGIMIGIIAGVQFLGVSL